MASASQTSPRLVGPQVVKALLQELHGYLYGAPGNVIDGTPQEIVKLVVENNDRFNGCSEGCIRNLRRQLVLALTYQGATFGLMFSRLSGGRIQVAVAA